MGAVKLRRTDARTAEAMNTLILPGDSFDSRGVHWLAADAEGNPLGFCSACEIGEGYVFLSRAGLLPAARGLGLQRRMIATRLAWARRQGAVAAITYVVYENPASLVNLLRCGFRFYRPATQFAGEVHYLHKDLI
jgi:GNAT superfamily N-acetyltransferase